MKVERQKFSSVGCLSRVVDTLMHSRKVSTNVPIIGHGSVFKNLPVRRLSL